MPASKRPWPPLGWACAPCLLTMNADTVAQMSCNPAIGGVAKGQIVREIDALGGGMGRVIDATGIQFRMLNRTKGPAMHSPRAQADKKLYQFTMKRIVEEQPNLTLRQEMVEGLLLERGTRNAERGAEETAADSFRVSGVRGARRHALPSCGRRPHHRHVSPGVDAHRRGQNTGRPSGRSDCRGAQRQPRRLWL